MLLGLALVLGAVALLFVPFLGEKREVVASTPGSLPLFEPPGAVGLASGNRACIEPLTVSWDTEIAHLVVGTYGREGPPLRATLEAGGASRSATASGYADNSAVAFEFGSLQREAEGSLCVENEGATAVTLNGTREQRTLARPVTRVDGGPPEEVDVAVTFLRSERASIARRLGDVFERAAAYRPGAAWLMWPLALAVVIAVPAGAFWAVFGRR